jgi:integrase
MSRRHGQVPDFPASMTAGLLARLMAAVRPEFRADTYFPGPDDAVLGVKQCKVADCDRSTGQNGLCPAHVYRWRLHGPSDLAGFLADPGPPVKGRAQPGICRVPQCRYGVNGRGLCLRHYKKWKDSGQDDPVAWAAAIPARATPDEGRPACALPWCSSWAEHSTSVFCKTHTARWRQRRCPDVEEFITCCAQRGKARVDFRGLAPQLKLEFQYAIQRRRDDQAIAATPRVVTWAIRQATDAGAGSLLEHSEKRWRQIVEPTRQRDGIAFLVYARDAVEDLCEGTGWEVEYHREVWRLHKLTGPPQGGDSAESRNHLRFDRITQPWLKALAKRWARLRLCSGLSAGTVARDILALTRFSEFLAAAAPAVDALAGVDRPLLERYLGWLATQPYGPTVAEDAISGLQVFFQAIRQHGWDDTLPTTATFFTGDSPPRPPRVTRHLAEHVMAQVELPASLDRWPTPDGRLVTMILIRCGLRASDACSLPFDCLLHDGQGAPYLRYRNNKMRREAAVPIDEELEAEVHAQQRRVLGRWPGGSKHLFPRAKANAGGQRRLSYNSYRDTLNRWLASCEVRDEHGQPVKLTPHQWRRTFACRLINRDVPQEVIRVLLDHESTQMTAHYAKLTDQTVRRRWEQATKVNTKGDRVTIDPDGPLAQAQWAKTRYGMATQTLSNGWCGLPIQKSCPHANACLTCPVFLTGPEFLPELRDQRRRALTLIDHAATAGQTRVTEMNKRVLANLDIMITEVEKQAPAGRDEQTGNADAG